MDNNKGVVYVATGREYIEMAARSAISLKSHSPDLQTHVFTDCDIASYDCFDGVTEITDPHFRSKIDCIPKTPFERTLFLDADTRICEDISSMFELLDRHDIALAHAPARDKQWEKYGGEAPRIFSLMNSGVILYKRTGPVKEFFKAWKKAYIEKGLKRDEYSLREQLWASDLKLWVLPPEYNCRPKNEILALRSAAITPKILHIEDFKREVGIMPKYYSLPLKKKLRIKLKHMIKGMIRYRFESNKLDL